MSWMGDDDALEQLESAVDQKLAVKDTTVLVEGPLCMVIAILVVLLFWGLGKHKKAKKWFAPRAGAEQSFYQMFRASDYDLLKGHGNTAPVSLDFVLCMKYHRLIRDVTLIAALFSFGIIIPVTVFGDTTKETFSSEESLSQGLVSADINSMLGLTISDVRGNTLWAYIASNGLILISSCAVIWWHCNQAMALRRSWIDRKNCCDPELHHRTLLVFETPLEVESTFALLRGMLPWRAATKRRDSSYMARLLQEHNLPEPKFTQGFHLKRNKLIPFGPTYLRTAVTDYNTAIIQLENLLCNSRPPKKTVEQLLDDIVKAESMYIKRHRQAHKKKGKRTEPYWFLTFESVYEACEVYAFLSQGHSTLRGHVYKSPAANDMIWENLSLTTMGVVRRKLLGWAFFCGLTLVISVPVALVVLFINIEILAVKYSWAKAILELNPAIAVSLVGALPPGIMAFIVSVVLPAAFAWVARYEGSISKSGSERGTFRRCYAFLAFYMLFCFVGFSQILRLIVAWKSGELQGSNVEAWDFLLSLTTAYITTSNYWLTWLPMKAVTILVHLMLGLKQTVAEMAVSSDEGITPRQALRMTKPKEYEEGYLTATALLECTVGLVYAPIAPCVTVLAGLVLCAISAVVCICEDEIDSGGVAWSARVYRLLAAFGMTQGLSTFMIYLRSKNYAMLGASLGLLGALSGFAIYLRRQLGAFERYIPEGEGTIKSGQEDFGFLHPLLNTQPRPLTRLWLTPDGVENGQRWLDERALSGTRLKTFSKVWRERQEMSGEDIMKRSYSELKAKFSGINEKAAFARDVDVE